MAGKFETQHIVRTAKFFFNLKASNGQIILVERDVRVKVCGPERHRIRQKECRER